MRLERAKLNQQILALAEAERLNHQALRRVKKFKVSEQARKGLEHSQQQKVDKLKKHQEAAQKNVRDAERYQLIGSLKQYKQDTSEAYRRHDEKREQEKEESKRACRAWIQNQGVRD